MTSSDDDYCDIQEVHKNTKNLGLLSMSETTTVAVVQRLHDLAVEGIHLNFVRTTASAKDILQLKTEDRHCLSVLGTLGFRAIKPVTLDAKGPFRFHPYFQKDGLNLHKVTKFTPLVELPWDEELVYSRKLRSGASKRVAIDEDSNEHRKMSPPEHATSLTITANAPQPGGEPQLAAMAQDTPQAVTPISPHDDAIASVEIMKAITLHRVKSYRELVDIATGSDCGEEIKASLSNKLKHNAHHAATQAQLLTVILRTYREESIIITKSECDQDTKKQLQTTVKRALHLAADAIIIV